jgi:hypothetical protein
MAAQVKYGCAWISAERWAELAAQCVGTTPPLNQNEREGRRIVRIVEQLPR